MRDHPDIERTIRTGYPSPEPKQVECEECSDEMQEWYTFEDMKFCTRYCLIEWLTANDYVGEGNIHDNSSHS